LHDNISVPKVEYHAKGYIPYWHPQQHKWMSYRTVALYIKAVEATIEELLRLTTVG
jgi:hypothetical protein